MSHVTHMNESCHTYESVMSRERTRARVFERERQEESDNLTTKALIRGMLTFNSIIWTLTRTSHTNTHFILQFQSRAKRPVHKNELSPEELQKQMDHFTEVRARIISVQILHVSPVF